MPALPPPPAPSLQHLTWIVDSFQRLTGRSLVVPGSELRTALWESPAVIVAHGIETDPVFFYGNRAALTIFDMTFADFTQLPSRYSAEPLLREERSAFLTRVSRDGFIDDYAGVRISSGGKRFRIEQAVVWNLIDAAGACHGQAATFAQWTSLD